MKQFRNCSIVFFLLVSLACSAQKSEVIKNYIDTYKNLAMAEMQRTGVPASITLAQGIHESGAGVSKLVLSSNNHFGIKCKSNWTGESVKHDDDARGECFRKYSFAEDSYRDHSNFLKNGQRYASLFALDPADYKGWANGLKKAGYATNPKYPQVLIKLIEDYGLQDYTLVALGKMPVPTDILAAGNVITGQAIVPSDKKDDDDKQVLNTKPVYPAGEFKIHDTKVIYAKQGSPFLAIAKQYDVDLSKIFEFNEITRMETVPADQLIYLQRKRKTGKDEFHMVMPGETLHVIAQLQAIRLESLLELNWLKDNEKPAPGQQLSLKKKSSSMPKLAVRENYILTPEKTRTSN